MDEEHFQVDEQLIKLEGEICALSSITDVLRARLVPILRIETDGVMATEEPQEPLVPLAANIRRCHMDVRDLRNRIDAMIELMEI